MISTPTIDWRKRAQAILTDEETELAFMRQAFVFIESKARPLIQDPYFIGFEIVQKNDANTNIVGLFVFRVEGNLMYAPTFYKNGEVKGTNILYSAGERLTVPLTPEWANYYVGKYSNADGALVDERKMRGQSRGINFEDLSHPEYLRKKASAETEAAWNDMRQLAQITATESSLTKVSSERQSKLLTKYLETVGQPGMEKLAAMIESSHDFAEAMVTHYDNSEWLDVTFPEDGQTKEAARTEPGSLVLHVGEFNPNAEVSRKEQFGRGYSLSDTRKETAQVYDSPDCTFEEITCPGLYKVVDNVGLIKELVAFKVDRVVCPERKTQDTFNTEYDGWYVESAKLYKNPRSSNTYFEAGYDIFGTSTKGQIMLYDPKSKKYTITKCAYGSWVDELEEGEHYKTLDKVKNDDYGFILIKGESLSVYPNHVKDVETEDGITRLRFRDYGCYTYNPDVECSCLDLAVLGKDALFVPIKSDGHEDGYDLPCTSYEEEKSSLNFVPGDAKAVTDFLLAANVKKASITRLGDNDFRVTCDGVHSHVLSKIAASVAVADILQVHGDTAVSLVDRAHLEGKSEFLVKSAAIRLDDLPTLDRTSVNPDFGVLQDQPDSYVITGDRPTAPHPNSRVGDRADNMGMGMTISITSTGSPEELYELSQTTTDSSIFDLGVVGSLVSTYDGKEAVEQFLPDLRQGLDRMGRILFLMYWKPEDFIDIFGAEDSSDVESRLLSTFKQYGEVVLDLIQTFKFEDTIDMNSLTR